MSFKRLMPFWVFVLIIIAISVISMPTALFGAEPDNPVSSDELHEENPLLRDAEIYAQHHSVTVDEAIRRFKLQDVAGALDGELSSKEAETFAGLWIEHTPEFKVVVLFTRNAEKTIKPYIQSYQDLAEIIEVRTAKASLFDLQSAQSKILSSARSLGIPVDSEINVFENRVKVHVADRIQIDNALRNGKLRLPDNVDVITVKALAKPVIDIYGGLSLLEGTSGFAVKTSGGTKGITTAGHAFNFQCYWVIFPLPLQQERLGTYYDVQWHTTPLLTVKNKIRWWSDGTTRDITGTVSRGNQVIGGYVAKYGRTTNYTAGYICSKTATLSYIPNCQPTFIKVDNTAGYSLLADVGDSGGPWFLVNNAYGMTCAKDQYGDAYYMAVNYVSGVGVSVMTSP